MKPPKAPKPWQKSKTIWINVLVIVLGAAMELGRIALDQSWIPEGGWVATILGGIGVWMRILTRGPVHFDGS